MKQIEMKLSLDVVAPLLDMIKAVGDTLENELAVPLSAEQIDDDLRENWRDELVAAQKGDIADLLALFDSRFFATGVVNFVESDSEAILRSCAVVRLRLRNRFLGEMPDETLEQGKVSMEELPDAVRRAFLCYFFLATVQELIITHFHALPGEP